LEGGRGVLIDHHADTFDDVMFRLPLSRYAMQDGRKGGTIGRIRGLENLSVLQSVQLGSGAHTVLCLKITVDSGHGVNADGYIGYESPLVTCVLNSHLNRVTIPDAVLILLSS